ncbi:MAG: hypothetical protein JO111_17680 [Caulobacteraceae bacterium]|nr:hypothetical protein [Caulobacteraceae bacterium]
MTPPFTISGAILGTKWFQDRRRRRLSFLAAAIVLGLLCLFPQHYKAETELLPQEAGGGLAQLLAQQGSGSVLSLSSLTGENKSVETDLTIARSHVVIKDAVNHLHARFPDRTRNVQAAMIGFKTKLTIIAIRGSILQIAATDHDPAFAQALVTAVADGIRTQIAAVNLEGNRLKREVAENRMKDATQRLANAQQALTNFRIANHLAEPQEQLGAGVGALANLQGQLVGRQVQLAQLQQVATPDNLQMKVVETEIASLQKQIADVQSQSHFEGAPGLVGLSATSATYFNLYRDQITAQLLYTLYQRYLEELTIDAMSSNENIETIEPPYVHPERQYNILPIALLFVTIVLFALAEFYDVRPPRGAR